MKSFRINRSILFSKKENGKTVLFCGGESKLYVFNDTAAFILSRLKRNQSKDQVLSAIVKYYAISIKDAKKDFMAFIDLLKRKNILVPRNLHSHFILVK